jgi:trans-L-3-hydroxyproline dehydratase
MPKPWKPPSNWTVFKTIDAHAAGEPLRIIIEGFSPIPGNSIIDKRRYAQDRLDQFRTALMWEPRGHADMYGCIITEPVSPDSQMGALFLHNAGFSTMCGHGIIALATVALEAGLVKVGGPRPILKIDTPAGQISATANMEGGKVKDVSFLNVPSFVYALDKTVNVPGLGNIRVDVAFGGAFYAFCRADDLGVRLIPEDFRHLIHVGMRVKRAVMDSVSIRHPFVSELGFLYGTIIVGVAEDPAHHSRNVCIFAEGEVDRSPTGTGLGARAALHYARQELKKGEIFTVESILGTCFSCRVTDVIQCGPYQAVVPEVTGCASITGRNEILIDPEDPLRYGFILR